MNLYELTANAAYLQHLLEDGDIDEQTFADSLESLMIDDKVESICKVIRNLEAEATAFKEEAARLTKRQKTAENGVQRLKDSLVHYLQTTENPKITSGLFTVSLCKAPASCEITSEDQIPDSFFMPQPPVIDRAAIKELLKQGIDVPGARLTQSTYVRIK